MSAVSSVSERKLDSQMETENGERDGKAEIEDWHERFLLGAENALRSRPKDEEALRDEQIKKLKQKIGDLVLDNDILREALKPYPLDRKTSDG